MEQATSNSGKIWIQTKVGLPDEIEQVISNKKDCKHPNNVKELY